MSLRSRVTSILTMVLTMFVLDVILIAAPARATIYGNDDLVDVLATKNSMLIEMSRSVAVQVRNGAIRFDQPFMSRTLESALVCPNERFVRQPTVSACTASLIGPRHILTASHCLAGYMSACHDTSWVFDFFVKNEGAKTFSSRPENVYRCARIIEHSYLEKLDYAIIELDREVQGRRPLELDLSGNVLLGQRVFSIHSPRGLPLKYSDGFVRDDSGQNHFTTTIDLMRGSSGAPVFDATTNRLIGIVAQGDHDYELQDDRFCNAYKRCKETECRGEDATRLSRAPGDFLSSIASPR